MILSQIEEYPIFFKENPDLNEIRKVANQVPFLMSYIFSPHEIENSMSGVSGPFTDDPIFESNLLKSIENNKAYDFKMVDDFSDDKCMYLFTKLMFAYAIILKKFYNSDISMDYFIRYRLDNKLNGLVKYFKFDFDSTYIDVKYKNKLVELSDDDIKKLINNPSDMDLWLKMLPLDQFEFTGFMKYKFVT